MDPDDQGRMVSREVGEYDPENIKSFNEKAKIKNATPSPQNNKSNSTEKSNNGNAKGNGNTNSNRNANANGNENANSNDKGNETTTKQTSRRDSSAMKMHKSCLDYVDGVER